MRKKKCWLCELAEEIEIDESDDHEVILKNVQCPTCDNIWKYPQIIKNK